MKRIFPILAAALIFTALVTALAGPTPTVNAQTGGLTPVEMAEAISRLGQQSLTVHVSGGLTYFALANSGSSLWGGMRFLAQAHDFVPVSAYATGISVRIEVRFVDPTVVSYMGEHRWIILDLGTWSAAFVPVLKEHRLFEPAELALAPALVPELPVTTLTEANGLFPTTTSSPTSIGLPDVAPAPPNLYLLALAALALIVLGGGGLAFALARVRG